MCMCIIMIVMWIQSVCVHNYDNASCIMSMLIMHDCVCPVYVYRIAPNFRDQNNFVIFVRCKLITKFLSTKMFTPMRVYWSSNESRKVLSVRSFAG